jgi:hypothetical protein
MKKIIYAAMFFLAITMMCGNAEKAKAKSYKAGKFKYQYKNTKKGVWITKITPLSSKGISKLNIPAKIKGKKVVKLGNTKDKYGTDDEARNIFGLMMCDPDGVGNFVISNTKAQKRIEKIKKINLPSSIVSITPRCFYYVQDGKEINIPKGVKKEVVNQFTRVKWKKVKISSNNKIYKLKSGCLLSKNGKILYGLVYKKKKLIVPKTVIEINTSDSRDTVENTMGDHGLAFFGCETMVISKNVEKINFYIYNCSLMKVEVDPANKYFASKDGSLYNKKNGKLIWLHQNDGIYNIPDGVKEIPYDFYADGKAKKMIIPASTKKVSNVSRYFSVKDAIVVCCGKEPPILTENKWLHFNEFDVMNFTIYVPKGCKETYEKAWKLEGEYVKFTFVEQ